MMNKSLRARARESSRNHFYGFQRPVFQRSPDVPAPLASLERTKGPGNLMTLEPFFRDTFRCHWDHTGDGAKKEPPFPAAFEVDNREASNRVDRSHSVSKEDAPSHT
jgi:hypothetical protein